MLLKGLQICALSLWVLCTGCDQATKPLASLTLGVEASMLPAAVWVAEEKGFFKDAGLDVSITEYSSGRLSFEAMLAGDQSIDISTVAPTPIMFRSFTRQDFSILATFAYSDTDLKVIARKDQGISTAEDLKGKRLGTPIGTTGQFFTDVFLTHHYLNQTDIELIDIDPNELAASLYHGTVDGIVIWEPHAHKALSMLGSNAISLPSADMYRETFNFMVMNDFARKHPNELKQFLMAISRATNFIHSNTDEAQHIVIARLGLDNKTTQAIWHDFNYELSLDMALLITLEDEARWAIERQLTGKRTVPNYLNYIFSAPLLSIAPDSVEIPHPD